MDNYTHGCVHYIAHRLTFAVETSSMPTKRFGRPRERDRGASLPPGFGGQTTLCFKATLTAMNPSHFGVPGAFSWPGAQFNPMAWQHAATSPQQSMFSQTGIGPMMMFRSAGVAGLDMQQLAFQQQLSRPQASQPAQHTQHVSPGVVLGWGRANATICCA